MSQKGRLSRKSAGRISAFGPGHANLASDAVYAVSHPVSPRRSTDVRYAPYKIGEEVYQSRCVGSHNMRALRQ